MKTLRTNTGFVIPRPAGASLSDEFYGSPVFNELQLDLVNKSEISSTWAWRKNAVLAIKDVFSLNKGFFKGQIFSGQPMNPRCVDFLHSTLTFIMTGKRQLSVQLWNDLLKYHPTEVASVSSVTKDHFQDQFGMIFNCPESKLISMWLAQPGGLEDMVTTAFIIFGDLPANWQDI